MQRNTSGTVFESRLVALIKNAIRLKANIADLATVATTGSYNDLSDKPAIANIPIVSSADNGKFLRVVSGAWAAVAVPSAESNSFGGGS